MQHVGTNDLLYLPIFCCIIVPFHQLLPQKFRWKGCEGSLMIWSIFIKTRSLCCWATDTWSPDWLPWSRAGIFLWYWKCIYQIMHMKPKTETHSAGHLIGLVRNNMCAAVSLNHSVYKSWRSNFASILTTRYSGVETWPNSALVLDFFCLFLTKVNNHHTVFVSPMFISRKSKWTLLK